MNTLGLPQIKYVNDLKPGELCWIETGAERHFAICIDPSPSQVILGVMPQDLSAWSLAEIRTRKQCASLGEEWVLEAGSPSSWEFTRVIRKQDSGGAFASESGPVLLFKTPEWEDDAFYHLDEKQIDGHHPGTSVQMKKFKIWASPEHRDRPGATPIFEV